MTLKGRIIITGGAGFLGRNIVSRAISEKWNCDFSILSRDPIKHHKMQQDFPKCRYIVGDICDLNGLSKAFTGHDIVIHAGAFKHIPDGERNVRETIRVNVEGSDNVARAAIMAQVNQVIGISTDKVCHPVNVYGATKMMMERLFQEYDRIGLTRFHLVRYGNVLASTGSVLTVWKKMLERDGFVTATSPDMTRFWMGIEQAVDAVLLSIGDAHGTVTIPKCKALDMGTFAKYTMPEGAEFRYTGLRPGEKKYEKLITEQESPFANEYDSYFRLYSSVMPYNDPHGQETHSNRLTDDSYQSDNCEQLTRDELLEMLK